MSKPFLKWAGGKSKLVPFIKMYILQLENINAQDVAEYEQQNNIKLKDFIIQLIQSKKMIKEIGDLKVDNEIKSLGASLAKYAKSKPILTDEQTNLLVRQKFAEKWVANESH